MKRYKDLRQLDMFFGAGNYKTHKHNFVSYKSILNDNVIILRTNNVVDRKILTENNVYEIEYVMMVGPQEAIYLPHYNIHRSSYYKDNKIHTTYLVKLDRRYYKPVYYPHKTEKKVELERSCTFDALYEHARLQELEKTKVYF